MSLQKLLTALIALAVLFAPAITSAAAARAAIPDHPMQMMESGHCTSMPSGHHDKSDRKSCCISVSIGLAVAPFVPVAGAAALASAPVYFLAKLHRPYLGEIATPPPRQS
ncbi:MAG: hypothetical protein ACJ8FS_16785 [Sphingomicrobium sp.]